MSGESVSHELFAGAPAVRLSTGALIPLFGLGVWMVPRDETEQVVRWALEAGYRHIDTAAAYRNEEGVGRGLRASGLPRDEVFVTTKLRPGAGEPRRQLETSLEKLGLEHVDLYLIHWPGPGHEEAWPGLERLHAEGLARAIGVSNYDPALLRRTVEAAEVPPAVNQIEWHPGVHSPAVADAHRDLGVLLESYSPLGHGRLVDDATVVDIARRLGRTPAQVLVRWCIERDTPTIPKTRSRERIVENAAVFDFLLEPEDVARLDALASRGR